MGITKYKNDVDGGGHTYVIALDNSNSFGAKWKYYNNRKKKWVTVIDRATLYPTYLYADKIIQDDLFYKQNPNIDINRVHIKGLVYTFVFDLIEGNK